MIMKIFIVASLFSFSLLACAQSQPVSSIVKLGNPKGATA